MKRILCLLTLFYSLNAYEPTPGQEGKDVIWLPSSPEVVSAMLDLAEVGPGDLLVDLGSGDGRTVIEAAKRGAKAIGVEYDPNMVQYAQEQINNALVQDKAVIVQNDFFDFDLKEANVVSMFLLNSINLKLRDKLLSLKPGTRIVTNTFTMGDWQPEKSAHVKNANSAFSTAYLYIVPKKVEGKWNTGTGHTLELKQEFQKVKGFLGDRLVEGRVNGDNLELNLVFGLDELARPETQE